ncbi:hypothetical protein L1785_14140 [Antribacter sp. KLBMP9083]|uniref:RAMA domain-containing protein n=1 Tax=Antribacter soli TaxID=2910976 RepID=A0AA41QES9_9MICO|nr:hypothetical protein [Antribacter soli]MCF4122118.1 hypothetical protein [Antribacter soli]
MPLFEVDATRPLLVQSARGGAGGSGGREPGVHTSAHQVVESHIDGLLGEQVFPIVQGTSPDEPHLLALDAAGSPVVVELVGDLDRDNLTKALDHAGAAGRLTRTELAARYHGGSQAFAHDVAAFYDSVPVTRSQQSKSGSARLIIICQNAPEEILNAVEFLRQPSMPVEVLKMGVVHSADGRRFLDVSPLVIHLPPALPMPKKKVAPQVAAPRPAGAKVPAEDAFAEGVKVGYALTGKMPVVAQAPQPRSTTAERTPRTPVAAGPAPVDPAPSVASLRARLAQGKAAAEPGPGPAAPASARPAGGTRASRRALAAAQAAEAAPAVPPAPVPAAPVAVAPLPPAPVPAAPVPPPSRASARTSDASPARPALSTRRSEVSESIPAVAAPPVQPPLGAYESAPYVAAGHEASQAADPAPVRRRSRSDRFNGQVDGEAAPRSGHTPVPPPPAPSPVPPAPVPAEPAAGLWQPPSYDGPPTRETPVYEPTSFEPSYGAPAAYGAPQAAADDNPVEYGTQPFDVESTFGAPEYEPPTYATSPGYDAPAAYVPTYDSVPANDSYSSSGYTADAPYGAAQQSYDGAGYEPVPAAAGGYGEQTGYVAEPSGYAGEQTRYAAEYGGYAPPPSAPFEPPYAPAAPAAGAGADDRQWDQGYVGAGYDAAPPAYDETPAVPVPSDIRTGTPMLFEDEDDPDLAALARSIGEPTRIVWSRPRRNQHYEGLLHPDGAIELADGSRYRHPDSAATAASGSYTADGWSVWRLGDTGPTLTDAFRMRFS